MQRIRIPVLVGFAVGAVLAFLVAPSTGLFARVPLMVLCGVLALIWQLAVSGIGRSGRSSGGVRPSHISGPRPRTEEFAQLSGRSRPLSGRADPAVLQGLVNSMSLSGIGLTEPG